MKRFKSLLCTLTVLTAMSCAEWKLVKETGSAPVEKPEENVYVLKREVLGGLDEEKAKASLELMRGEYVRRVIMENKAVAGQEKMILDSTKETFYVADYERRSEQNPRQKTLVAATFRFDQAGFNLLVNRDFFAKNGLRIYTAVETVAAPAPAEGAAADAAKPAETKKFSCDPALAGYLASLAPAWQVMTGTALKSFADDGLWVAPKAAAADAVKLICALGGGEAAVNADGVQVTKMPDPAVAEKLTALADMAARRRMISMAKFFVDNGAADSPLKKMADERIAASKDMAAAIDLKSVNLSELVEKIYLAADKCSEGPAEDVFKKFAASLKSAPVSLKLEHPAGKGYAGTGYDLPFAVSLAQGRSVLRAEYEVISSIALTVGANKYEHRRLPCALFQGPAARTEFYVNSIGAAAGDVAVRVSMRDYEKRSALFSAAWNVSLDSILPQAKVELKNIAVEVSAAYAKGDSLKKNASVTLENKVMSLKAAENGQFTIGGFIGEDAADFMYGHPNGKLADGIWSSYISISVNGTIYRLDKLPGQVTANVDGKKLVKVSNTEDGKIQITQTLTFTEGNNGARIELTFKNLDPDAAHVVGARLLLDTWAVKNDGVPFRLPVRAADGKYGPGELITAETEFSGLDTPYFLVSEEGAGEKLVLRGDFNVPGAMVPERVVLAAWERAYNSEWQYVADKKIPVIHDSAVLVYYNPRKIEAGRELTVAMNYGRDTIRDNIVMPSVIRSQSSSFVCAVGYYNDTLVEQKPRIELVLSDNRLRFADDSQSSAVLAGAPGTEGVAWFKLAATGLDSGKSPVIIRVQDSRGLKEYAREVEIVKSPLVITERVLPAGAKELPVRFSPFDEVNKDVVFVAQLVRRDGTELARKLLLDDGKSNDGAEKDGVYGTVFSLEGIAGDDVLVKIFEVAGAGK
jgi:hypothetical protein